MYSIRPVLPELFGAAVYIDGNLRPAAGTDEPAFLRPTGKNRDVKAVAQTARRGKLFKLSSVNLIKHANILSFYRPKVPLTGLNG